jgi:cytochrome c-type biogenesis protein CcmF
MVIPLGATLLVLMGIGPALPWGRATSSQMKRALLPPLIGAAVFAIAGYALGVRSAWTLLTLAFGGYAAQVTFAHMRSPLAQVKRARRRFASYIVHAGVILAIIAIAVSSTMKSEVEVNLNKGGTATLAGYNVTLLAIEEKAEPHRQSTIARFAISKNGAQKTILEPRMNQYQTMREPIGSPDVYTTPKGDLYLSALAIDPIQQTVGVHIIYNPMVMWIWVAVMLMGLGGLIAVVPAAFTRPVAIRTVSGAEGEEPRRVGDAMPVGDGA